MSEQLPFKAHVFVKKELSLQTGTLKSARASEHRAFIRADVLPDLTALMVALSSALNHGLILFQLNWDYTSDIQRADVFEDVFWKT